MKRVVALAMAVVMAAGGLMGCSKKEEYPSQNINVIVQYSAGGGTDLSVRGVLDAAAEDLPSGVNFAVSNVTGGAGLIGLNEVMNASSDGYTLGVVNTDLIINMCLGRTEMTLDDFTPVASALMDPFVLIVSADAPYQTFEEFIDYAKEHPGEVAVGDTGIGAAPTLAVSALQQHFGIEFKNVTYDGSADCVTAIVGGHIDATIAQSVNAASQVEAGNLAIIATMADERMATYPDVPTMKEIYPDIDFAMLGFCIISTKSDVETEKTDYLAEILQKAVDSDSYQERLVSMGMQTVNMNTEELRTFLDQQMEMYAGLCEGIEVE